MRRSNRINKLGMKLSKKKEDELYRSVYEDIMHTRIKISVLLKGKGIFKVAEEVDALMADLLTKAPEEALSVFKSDKP